MRLAEYAWEYKSVFIFSKGERSNWRTVCKKRKKEKKKTTLGLSKVKTSLDRESWEFKCGKMISALLFREVWKIVRYVCLLRSCRLNSSKRVARCVRRCTRRVRYRAVENEVWGRIETTRPVAILERKHRDFLPFRKRTVRLAVEKIARPWINLEKICSPSGGMNSCMVSFIVQNRWSWRAVSINFPI